MNNNVLIETTEGGEWYDLDYTDNRSVSKQININNFCETTNLDKNILKINNSPHNSPYNSPHNSPHNSQRNSPHNSQRNSQHSSSYNSHDDDTHYDSDNNFKGNLQNNVYNELNDNFYKENSRELFTVLYPHITYKCKNKIINDKKNKEIISNKQKYVHQEQKKEIKNKIINKIINETINETINKTKNETKNEIKNETKLTDLNLNDKDDKKYENIINDKIEKLIKKKSVQGYIKYKKKYNKISSQLKSYYKI